MEITQEQWRIYQEQGFLLVPEYFSRSEIERMKAELPPLFAEDTPARVLEKEGKAVRAVHGSHTKNEIFRRLSQHSRLVKPAMQILGSPVYIYQFKINAKAAFSGDIWDWHQDYIFWHKQDGMPKPRVINAMVLLDDMNEFNGPLFVMPGSHREGMIDSNQKKLDSSKSDPNSPEWISSFTAKLKYSLEQELVADLALKYGMFAIKAAAGSVVFFDSNIIHASPSNISPFDRNIVIVTYNSVENIPLPVANPRPEFLVSRDYRPIEPLSDELLSLSSVN